MWFNARLVENEATWKGMPASDSFRQQQPWAASAPGLERAEPQCGPSGLSHVVRTDVGREPCLPRFLGDSP